MNRKFCARLPRTLTAALVGAGALVVGALAPTAISGGPPAGASGHTAAAFGPPKSGYLVYWDQNEEEDYYASATGHQGQLITPWDPNGQMCPINNGSGDFVVGYDPTLPSQHNPGGPPHHPYKRPPIGEELDNVHGKWTHKDLFVAGPYKGGDSPPVGGVYNGQSTYTGCAVDSHHNVFADDIATAQGQYPPPSSGRLVEWFAPTYRRSCILYGPTQGGTGSHHVDGTGGLEQPGMMAAMANGNLLVPQAASARGPLKGDVLEFHHSSFPTSASQCPDGVYQRSQLKVTTFFKGRASLLPVPMGVAHDPKCQCWAIDSVFGSPSIAFFNNRGKELLDPKPLRGESLQQFGHDRRGFNPFGMAFAPDGTLYFVDIHIHCSGPFIGCGPQSFLGRVFKVAFSPDGTPHNPKILATGFGFPTSVTICVPTDRADAPCPFPLHPTPPPDKETQQEAGG
jgi:hypothetical protein